MEEYKYAGIDVGFGDVKVAIGNSYGKHFEEKFPTAIRYYNESAIGDIKTDEDKNILTRDGTKYVLGESALLDAFSTRTYDFLSSYIPLFVEYTERRYGHFKEIGLGLPLGYYTKENISKIQESLPGQKVSVYPQGVGAFVDFFFNGKSVDSSITGLVVDIGYSTVDVIYFEESVTIKEKSLMTDDLGLSVPVLQLKSFIQKKFNFSLSEQQAKEIFLKQELSMFGSKVDLTAVINELVRKYARNLFLRIKTTWKRELVGANTLLFVGGGAYYLKEHLPSNYKGIALIPETPEFCNARGFLKTLILDYAEQEK